MIHNELAHPCCHRGRRRQHRLGLETGSQKVCPRDGGEGGRGLQEEKLVLFTKTFALSGGGDYKKGKKKSGGKSFGAGTNNAADSADCLIRVANADRGGACVPLRCLESLPVLQAYLASC